MPTESPQTWQKPASEMRRSVKFRSVPRWCGRTRCLGRTGLTIDPEVAAVRWLARGEDDLPVGRDWLSRDEAAVAEGLRFTKRRTEYLLRRLVAKHAVAVLIGAGTVEAALARIEVRNAPTGAPYLLLDGEPSTLEVSISDRAGWAVCLVGDRAAAIGCDLELVEPRSDGFLRDFLTEAEQRYVAAQAGGDARDVAANVIWSAKESALKVLRTGLRRDARSVEVTVGAQRSPGWAALEVRSSEVVVYPGWWRRDGRFVMTVAAADPMPPPRALDRIDVLATAVPRHSWMDGPVSPP